jgi:hypothetical protein
MPTYRHRDTAAVVTAPPDDDPYEGSDEWLRTEDRDPAPKRQHRNASTATGDEA